jgi:C1A family cysteine protease
VIAYFRLHRDLDTMRACLAEGWPFTLGVSVHESFTSPRVRRTGVIPMPKSHEPLRGGHAMLAVGFDDRDQHLIVRNSWGTAWGIDGYCRIPYAFILHPSLSWDFWTCRRVAGG